MPPTTTTSSGFSSTTISTTLVRSTFIPSDRTPFDTMPTVDRTTTTGVSPQEQSFSTIADLTVSRVQLEETTESSSTQSGSTPSSSTFNPLQTNQTNFASSTLAPTAFSELAIPFFETTTFLIIAIVASIFCVAIITAIVCFFIQCKNDTSKDIEMDGEREKKSDVFLIFLSVQPLWFVANANWIWPWRSCFRAQFKWNCVR